MDKQSLSIAMCTYNGMQYLQEQLDSIATQTQLPDELVVCDDRSTDSTREIVKAFVKKVSFPVHLYLNEENLGTIKNFEKAISLCTGDIIALCDQDDVWKADKIEKIITAFAGNLTAGYVFSDAELVNENLTSLGYSLWQSRGFTADLLRKYTHGDQFRVLLYQNFVWGATMAFRSSLKNLVLPISSSAIFMHDAWIALLASCAGFYGVGLSNSLIYYRQHSTQQVGGKNTIFQKIKKAQNSKETNNFKILIQGLIDMKDRLILMQNTFDKDIAMELDLIQEKVDHFSKRVLIRSSNSYSLKLKIIVSEILAGKYDDFSNSWQSAAKDLFF